ncbi:MAG: VCBS repeat-containing protein [Ruminococcaceae bacterium]|nr:VCBS repeat-containing protein [Oscillospiraceae bacterium]
MKWITEGFEGFSKGSFENGGQNIYVSRKGVLQRIFQYDINLDGHPDLLFACSQSMYERPPLYLYKKPLQDQEPIKLPSNGTYSGCLADLHGNGYQDLVVACQNDGQHNDIASIIYFGSESGLTEKYKMELAAPNATDVVAGDFNGDGKQEILFVCHGKLRMFFQKGQGFNSADQVDYDIEAANIIAADFDGDGICDVAVKSKNGKTSIVFGSKDGLDVKRVLHLDTMIAQNQNEETGSTAGMSTSATQWRPCVVMLGGVQHLFCVKKEHVILYTCDSARQMNEALVLNCPNAVGAAATDLNGNGFNDLVVAVFTDRDKSENCRIYPGSADGICADNYVGVPVKGAVSVTAVSLDGNKVIFCRTGERIEKEVPCPVVYLDANGHPQVAGTLLGGDCGTILAGRPDGREGDDTVIMCNHMLNRGEGHEDVYVYLGGEDGYIPERKLCFPGHSAVDGAMIDFQDIGKVDVLISNCFEDAIFKDDGSYIYLNDGKNNFNADNKIVIPTVRGHGAAVADFRKSGYLDVVSGGFFNRELRIFHGSDQGYSLDHCTKIVLGPDAEGYTPPSKDEGADWHVSGEEQKLIADFGQVRWLFACDFNGDGWLDLFVSEIICPRCYVLWGGPDGFSKDRMTTLETDGVASANVADLNGNGYPDLLLGQHMSTKKADKYETYVTVYWGGPDGFKENRKMQLPTSCANAVTVGDYSGKGKLDLYAVAYRNSRCRDILSHLYLNDGEGHFSINNVKYLFNHSASGCVSGDFNGDGYTDLAIACHKEYGNHCSHSFVFWGGPDGLSDERKTILPTTGPHGMCTVDPDHIQDRGPRERYTSAVMTLPDRSVVNSISWEGECTSTSWVEVEVRAAKNLDSITDALWQRVDAGTDLSAMGLAGAVQYRLALCANCSCGTPRITKVAVDYK